MGEAVASGGSRAGKQGGAEALPERERVGAAGGFHVLGGGLANCRR